MTKFSKAGTLIEGDEGFETAAILASPSPLGITSMGTFPLSLIALGQIRRRDFDDSITPRPKKTRNATEELESPQKIEIAALTEQIETTRAPAHDRTRESRNMEPPNIYSRSFTLQHAKVAASGSGASLVRPDGPLGSRQVLRVWLPENRPTFGLPGRTQSTYLEIGSQNTAHWSKSRYRLFCVNGRYNSASDYRNYPLQDSRE
jgi:hypothetical protein